MKDFTSRFVAPLASARPRGGRLIEGFSPKLKRRMRLFSHASFAQWMRLEADPAVRTFCERPARLAGEPAARLVDFCSRLRRHRGGRSGVHFDSQSCAYGRVSLLLSQRRQPRLSAPLRPIS